MTPTLLTPPAALPVSLADVKDHLRVEHNDENTHLKTLIKSAVSELDGYSGQLGRAIITQTWQLHFADWQPIMGLPFPNVQSVEITYKDSDGVGQIVPESNYEILKGTFGDCVFFRKEFSPPQVYDNQSLPITFTFTAGYGSEENVPSDIKVALMLMVQLDYDQPDKRTADAIEKSIQSKITRHRWARV